MKKVSMWTVNHNKAELDVLLSKKLNLKTMHFTSKIEEIYLGLNLP